MEYWDGLWPNESFASGAQLYVQHQLFPEYNSPQDFLATEYQLALDLDSKQIQSSYPSTSEKS